LPDKTALNVILCVLVICVLPAVFEELIFRGFILNGLKVFGDRTAILISALLFSLYHMNPSQTLYQFIVGALFAFIAVSAKSIIPTIIAHFLNNFIIVVNYYFIGADPHGGLKAFLVITGLIALTVGLVILARECVLEKADKKVDKKAGWKEFALYSCGGIFAALIIWFSCFFA
jgi:membrane protease YdiL (CAAX protease family)